MSDSKFEVCFTKKEIIESLRKKYPKDKKMKKL